MVNGGDKKTDRQSICCGQVLINSIFGNILGGSNIELIFDYPVRIHATSIYFYSFDIRVGFGARFDNGNNLWGSDFG